MSLMLQCCQSLIILVLLLGFFEALVEMAFNFVETSVEFFCSCSKYFRRREFTKPNLFWRIESLPSEAALLFIRGILRLTLTSRHTSVVGHPRHKRVKRL